MSGELWAGTVSSGRPEYPKPRTTRTEACCLSSWPSGATFVDNGNGTGTLSYTAPLADAGSNFAITVEADDGTDIGSGAFTLFVPEPAYTGLLINEFLPDPNVASVHFDANQDGVESTVEDEYVELVNYTGADLDLVGVSIEDAFAVRHVFSSSLVVPAGQAVVVFGGGSLANFTSSAAETASTGGLSLNNGGDTIVLRDPDGDLIERVEYADPGVPDAASLNRNPDVTGESFANHVLVTGSGGLPGSPGLRVDGGSFTSLPDSDGDGLADVIETTVYGTNAGLFDTDGDGVGDWDEIQQGFDPLDPGSSPPPTVPMLGAPAAALLMGLLLGTARVRIRPRPRGTKTRA